MPKFEMSDRIAALPPYLFAEIDRKKTALRETGADVIDLGVGDPDQPTPGPVIDALSKAAVDPANHRYPSYEGMKAYRQACCDWMKRRYDQDFSADTDVVAVIGSKEGIANLPYAFVNPGDAVLVPRPGYPVYNSGTLFAGGRVVELPLTIENDFFPDLDAISTEDAKAAKILHLNYPNNPTSATVTRENLQKAVDFCREHEIILASDAAYCEIYFGDQRPLSIFEIDGAREVAIEFHSLSKTFNMTGWRAGWCVGNADIIAGLKKIKTNMDSGIFNAVQYAAMSALKLDDSVLQSIRDVYAERRKSLVAGLTEAGLKPYDSDVTFYVWTPIPEGETSAGFAGKILEQAHVVVTPGTGFGAPGEGYIRFALTSGVERLQEALVRIKEKV